MESNSNRKVSIGTIGHITLDKTDLISTIESAIYNSSKRIRKNHVTIGTIGSFNHGKTTLTAAILKVLYDINKKSVNSKSLEKVFEEIKKETTINLSHLEYETNYRHYTLIDCPGQEDYIKKIIAGMSQMNGAIFVIDGTQGINAETRKYFLLSRQIGIPKLVVFINKCDKTHNKKEIDLLENLK